MTLSASLKTRDAHSRTRGRSARNLPKQVIIDRPQAGDRYRPPERVQRCELRAACPQRNAPVSADTSRSIAVRPSIPVSGSPGRAAPSTDGRTRYAAYRAPADSTASRERASAVAMPRDSTASTRRSSSSNLMPGAAWSAPAAHVCRTRLRPIPVMSSPTGFRGMSPTLFYDMNDGCRHDGQTLRWARRISGSSSSRCIGPEKRIWPDSMT